MARGETETQSKSRTCSSATIGKSLPYPSSILILSFKFRSGWGAYIEQSQELPTDRSINHKNSWEFISVCGTQDTTLSEVYKAQHLSLPRACWMTHTIICYLPTPQRSQRWEARPWYQYYVGKKQEAGRTIKNLSAKYQAEARGRKNRGEGKEIKTIIANIYQGFATQQVLHSTVRKY